MFLQGIVAIVTAHVSFQKEVRNAPNMRLQREKILEGKMLKEEYFAQNFRVFFHEKYVGETRSFLILVKIVQNTAVLIFSSL